MSYDISFRVKLKKNYVPFGDFNMTYNVGNILRKSSGVTEWSGVSTLKVSDVYDKFANGLKELQTNRKEYTPLEPSNGWGSVDSVIRFYEWFFDMLEEFDKDEYELIEITVC